MLNIYTDITLGPLKCYEKNVTQHLNGPFEGISETSYQCVVRDD